MDQVTMEYKAKDWKLDTLQSAIQNAEDILGHARKMTSTSNSNKVTFDYGPIPKNSIVLETYTSSSPPAKEGFTLVASASLWVEGSKKKVAAYRKE